MIQLNLEILVISSGSCEYGEFDYPGDVVDFGEVTDDKQSIKDPLAFSKWWVWMPGWLESSHSVK